MEIAARFARPIRAIIDVWKGAKKLENGIKIEQNIAKHSDELRDLEKLGQRTTGKDGVTGGMWPVGSSKSAGFGASVISNVLNSRFPGGDW